MKNLDSESQKCSQSHDYVISKAYGRNIFSMLTKIPVLIEEHGEVPIFLRINNWLFKNDESKNIVAINLNSDQFLPSKQKFLRKELNIDPLFIKSY